MPGPIKILMANVTSLWPLREWAVALEQDVLVFTETRVTNQQDRGLAGSFRRAGWATVWIPATRTTQGGTTGGILVAAKAPRKLRLVKKNQPTARHKGRWAHVVLEGGKDESPIHLFPIYGYDRGQPDHLAMMLNEILRTAVGVGEVPVAILGDHNVEPSESPLMESLAPRWEPLRQKTPTGTCEPAERRLDYVLGNRAYRARAGRKEVDLAGPTAPHHPVEHELWVGPVAPRPVLKETTKYEEPANKHQAFREAWQAREIPWQNRMA